MRQMTRWGIPCWNAAPCNKNARCGKERGIWQSRSWDFLDIDGQPFCRRGDGGTGQRGAAVRHGAAGTKVFHAPAAITSYDSPLCWTLVLTACVQCRGICGLRGSDPGRPAPCLHSRCRGFGGAGEKTEWSVRWKPGMTPLAASGCSGALRSLLNKPGRRLNSEAERWRTAMKQG